MLWVEDTRHVASLHTLQRQRRNQSSTNTATVLSSQNLDGVLGLGVSLLGPVENLLQSLGTTSLEVRVLVEDGAIRTDVARLEVLLLANSSNTTGRETSRTGTNKFGESAEKLELGTSALDLQLVGKQIQSLLEVLKRIPIE